MFSVFRLASSKTPSPLPFPFRFFCSSTLPSFVPESDQQVVQLILDQKTTSHALETFRWISHLPNISHSQSTYRALCSRLCAFRRFDIVYNLLDEMPSSIGETPDDSIFVTIIKAYGRARMAPHALQVLNVLSKFGKTPSLTVLNSILDVLVKVDIDLAREFYNTKMKKFGIIGNDYTFGILMKGLCLTNKIGDGFNLLQALKSSGSEPNAVVYNTLISALCKNGRVQEAVEMLKRFELKGGEVDVVAYNTLMEGYCKIGDVKCGFALLKEMERKGYLPNVHTYSILIKGVCGLEMLDLALDLVKDMKNVGLSCNFEIYDVLIRSFFAGGRMKDGFKMLELMEDSKEGGRGRISPYNSVIYGFYKFEKWEKAINFLLSMERLFPRTVGKSLRILNLCEEDEIDDAMKVFDQMVEEGGSPCVIVYDRLINCLCKQGRVREAFGLMSEMVERRFHPVAATLNGIIKGSDLKALRFLEDMVREGCKADVASYGPLICHLCSMGNSDKAVMLLLQMVEKNIVPEKVIWESLLGCLNGDRDSIVRILN